MKFCDFAERAGGGPFLSESYLGIRLNRPQHTRRKSHLKHSVQPVNFRNEYFKTEAWIIILLLSR